MSYLDVPISGSFTRKTFEDLQSEIQRAIEKHGKGQTPLNIRMSVGEKLAILMEELGEVARATTYDNQSLGNLTSELLQLATMATAWYQSLSYSFDPVDEPVSNR